MSDERFERDLRRTLGRMTAEPASPALQARVRQTLATPRAHVRPWWRLVPRLAAGLAAVILVVGAAGMLIALRPQQAVGPAASASPGVIPSESPSAADPDSVSLARASSLIQALGYDVPEVGTVAEVTDTTTGATNTVVRFGTAWQVEWDPRGVLTFVFRTAAPAGTPAVTKDVAATRVMSAAAAVGYSIPTDSIPLTLGGGLWSASWPRTVNGVPTMGDDTGITLYADGSFAGFHRLERPLEPKPARVLTREEAQAALLAARSSRPSLLPVQITGGELEWAPPVAPGTGPSPTLRLCWVLTLKVVGGEPGQLARAVLDAGTATELWGDSTASQPGPTVTPDIRGQSVFAFPDGLRLTLATPLAANHGRFYFPAPDGTSILSGDWTSGATHTLAALATGHHVAGLAATDDWLVYVEAWKDVQGTQQTPCMTNVSAPLHWKILALALATGKQTAIDAGTNSRTSAFPGDEICPGPAAPSPAGGAGR